MTDRRLAARVAAGVLLVLLAGASRGLAAGQGWTIALAPSTIHAATATSIKATFTNLGGPDGTRDLGCVRISIPVTFTISHVSVTSEPPGTLWTASTGLGTVTFRATGGGDRLPPDGTSSVSGAITVLALTPGTYTWTANAYRQQDCTDPFNQPVALKVVVDLEILPLPTPTPKPLPTILPTALPSILPSLLPTPRPTTTPTPTPTPTLTPTAPPGSTPAPTPSPPATPAPATPVPTPTDQGSGPAASSGSTAGASTQPAGPTDRPGDGPTASPLGAALILPGSGPDDGSTGAGRPAISLTSGFDTPFGDGFEWAVPGLVLTVPGLLIVLIAIVAQAFGAAAWLPVVRRRIGGFELDPHRERGVSGPVD